MPFTWINIALPADNYLKLTHPAEVVVNTKSVEASLNLDGSAGNEKWVWSAGMDPFAQTKLLDDSKPPGGGWGELRQAIDNLHDKNTCRTHNATQHVTYQTADCPSNLAANKVSNDANQHTAHRAVHDVAYQASANTSYCNSQDATVQGSNYIGWDNGYNTTIYSSHVTGYDVSNNFNVNASYDLANNPNNDSDVDSPDYISVT